jgi:hypothetical protein
MRGDYSGAFTAGIRALTGQLGVPSAQNMIGRGVSTPAELATARGFMDPGQAAGQLSGNRGMGPAEIRAGNLIAGVPPQTASTARAYQYQTGVPRGTTGFTTGQPPPQNAPTAQAPPQNAPQTVQERVQWRAGYENWRAGNRLPDTAQNRERFNAERGYPSGSSSAAPAAGGAAAPAPAGTGAAPQARPPSYAEWLRANNLRPSNQNFIRFSNEIGRWRTPNAAPGPRSQANGRTQVAFAGPRPPNMPQTFRYDPNNPQRVPGGGYDRYESPYDVPQRIPAVPPQGEYGLHQEPSGSAVRPIPGAPETMPAIPLSPPSNPRNPDDRNMDNPPMDFAPERDWFPRGVNPASYRPGVPAGRRLFAQATPNTLNMLRQQRELSQQAFAAPDPRGGGFDTPYTVTPRPKRPPPQWYGPVDRSPRDVA